MDSVLELGFTLGNSLDQIMDLFFLLGFGLIFFLKSESESVNPNPPTST